MNIFQEKIFDQSRIIEQAKFNYSLLRKALNKTKTNEDQENNKWKQFGNDSLAHIKNKLAVFLQKIFQLKKFEGYELIKIKEVEKRINKDDLIYKIIDKKKDWDLLEEKLITMNLN